MCCLELVGNRTLFDLKFISFLVCIINKCTNFVITNWGLKQKNESITTTITVATTALKNKNNNNNNTAVCTNDKLFTS